MHIVTTDRKAYQIMTRPTDSHGRHSQLTTQASTTHRRKRLTQPSPETKGRTVLFREIMMVDQWAAKQLAGQTQKIAYELPFI
jgi:hypothetical protein